MADTIAEVVGNLARIRFADLPPGVIEVCKKDVVDTLAVAFAGSSAAGIPEIVELGRGWGGRGESSVIGNSLKLPSITAAFVNSSMGHALDFDDTHDEAVLHAGVCTVLPALALAESIGKVGGERLITAVACGIELMCRLGIATKLSPPQTGWVYTSVYGVFGAAETCAKLLDLNEEQTANALGIAYSCASGNMQCIEDGVLTKRMQPGFAARSGLEAALLARAGITGARNILDGKVNLFRVYHKDGYDRSRLMTGLGKDFELSNLSFKPYPSCRYTHPYIDAAISLRHELGGDTGSIESVDVIVGESERFLCDPLEVKRAPRSTVDGQFSIPWTVAVALSEGAVRIGDFTADAFRRPLVKYIAQKVHVKTAADVPERGIAKGTVVLRTKCGAVHSKSVAKPKGHPGNPMDWSDLMDKFKDCASWGRRKLVDNDVEEAVRLGRSLESLSDVGQIVRVVS